MKDKVQKIREEVERLRKSYQIMYQELDCESPELISVCAKRNLCQDILMFIDSLQEEPVSKVWHDAGEKPERENLLIETNDGRIIHRQTINNYGMVKRWAYTSDLLNLDNSCNFGKNLQKEPVSNPIDFEKELYKAFGQVKDFTLGMRIAKWFWDMGKNGQEPVSEELEEELSKLLKECEVDVEYVHQDFLHIVARHFANWQKVQMMANAVDVTVHIDAGGYPYTPEIELYDYDKDVPLAKEGDKYKVVLIKEV